MIQTGKVSCPHCGAPLSASKGQRSALCEYCNSTVVLSDTNEHVVRTIDETEIQRSMAEQAVRLKELDFALAKEKNSSDLNKYITIAWVAGAFIFLAIGVFAHVKTALSLGILIGIAGLLYKNSEKKEQAKQAENEKNRANGLVQIPDSIFLKVGKDINVVRAELEAAGLTNIECINMRDLLTNLSNRRGKVESIQIGGAAAYSAGGKWVSPRTKVVIVYHGTRKDP